jgi:4-hydroxybenzoate polyprenyltransferase/phosphoserine phosphatase
VDLDGTLVRSDTLWEGLWAGMAERPTRLLRALPALASGRAALKAAVSEEAVSDPATLPYDTRVLDLVRAHRAAGGRTVLCSAADRRVAQAVSAHLGLFDEVHASDGTRNLKGREKARFLAGRFGEGGFDYAGDAPADMPVWAAARRAITVGLAPGRRAAVASRGGAIEHLEGAGGGAAAHLKLIRPHQWLKNVLIALPLLAAHDLSAASWGVALIAFAAFSAVASAVYVLNDLLDVAADRAHPRKRLRPLAAATVPLARATAMAPALVALGALLGLATGSLAFLGVLALYLVLTTAYSLVLKRRVVIDICVLAGLYTLRIVAGGVATGTTLSVWLLAFSIFFFLSLAAVKRLGELAALPEDGPDQAAGRAYRRDDRGIVATMAVASGYLAVLVLALYLDTPQVRALYSEPALLWGVCPVLLYWVSRMALIADRGTMSDDPILFALTDRASWAAGGLVLGIGLAASLA